MPIRSTRKGYFTVWRNGQQVTRPGTTHSGNHANFNEARETADAHAEVHGNGVYTIRQPDYEVEYDMSFSIFSPGNSVPGSDPYDLTANAIQTAPSWVTDGTLQWPTEPTTTSTASVATAAEFNAAASVSGTQITVTSSFAGNISIPAGVTDIDVIMDNALTITGNLTLGGASYASRIRWTGGNIAGTLSCPRIQDLLFDDFYLVSDGALNNLTAASQPFNRVAFLNTTLEVINGAVAGDWALFMQPTGNLGNGQSSDLILANTKLISTGQNNRIQDVDRVVIVDSAFNPDGASANGMRIHYASDQVYIGNSFSVGLFKLDGSSGLDVTNAHFDRYDRYYTGYALHLSNPNTGTVYNSRLHGGTISLSPFTDGGGNDDTSWDGSTIDYSRLAGKSSIADFGAVR